MWWRLMNINEIRNEPLELHKFFVQTFLFSTILLFALAANMLDTSRIKAEVDILKVLKHLNLDRILDWHC